MKPSILFFALLVALCWGAYGPALAQSRGALISLVREWHAHGKLEGGLGLYAGLVAILVGAILVAYNTPPDVPPAKSAKPATTAHR